MPLILIRYLETHCWCGRLKWNKATLAGCYPRGGKMSSLLGYLTMDSEGGDGEGIGGTILMGLRSGRKSPKEIAQQWDTNPPFHGISCRSRYRPNHREGAHATCWELFTVKRVLTPYKLRIHISFVILHYQWHTLSKKQIRKAAAAPFLQTRYCMTWLPRRQSLVWKHPYSHWRIY